MAETAEEKIASLVTIFDKVINCFNGISFEKTRNAADTEVYLLKLDNARLRLSRWGDIVQLRDVNGDIRRLKEITEANIPHAKVHLEAILAAIEQGKTMDANHQDDQSLIGQSAETHLSHGVVFLHKTMSEIVENRWKPLPSPQKFKWALCDEAHFQKMIDKVADRTNKLQDLLPAGRRLEKDLVDAEALKLYKTLRLLEESIQNQDKTLASVLHTLLKPEAEMYKNYIHGGTVGVVSAHRSDIRQTFGSYGGVGGA